MKSKREHGALLGCAEQRNAELFVPSLEPTVGALKEFAGEIHVSVASLRTKRLDEPDVKYDGGRAMLHSPDGVIVGRVEK